MTILQFILDYLIGLVREHPVGAIIAVIAFVRLWGTVIQSGWTGVLFVLGRARRTLEPGFHFLLPLVHFVRKTPVRSVTLDLPRQHVTTLDGLVYEADANVVYHVDNAILALTQVDNLKKGALVVLAMAVQDVIGRHTRQSLQERQALDETLTALAQEKLRAWGVVVEQAGFKTIAPSKRTLRVTQLRQLVEERRQILDDYRRHGLSPELALVLLGSHRQLVGHARARYRRPHRRAGVHRLATVQTVPLVIAFSPINASTTTLETVVYESITEPAVHGLPLELQVGDKVRYHMATRRRVDKIIVQRRGPVSVQPVREDATLVEITAVKAGVAFVVLRNHQSGVEAVRVNVAPP
jgi:hypothetical protein